MDRRILVTLMALACAAPQSAQAQADRWRRVQRDELCVTTGAILGAAQHMVIDGPEVRATMRVAMPRAAELRFTYLGPTSRVTPLASGELRRQIGIKLRARDTCNVVYVMWHIAPDAKIAVSVKRGPGKHTHAECGARGYVTIRPGTSTATPAISPGSTHTLRATLRAETIEVVADGKLVFSGTIDRASLDFDGPVGLRTDNARFRFNYLVAPRETSPLSPPINTSFNHCHD